VDALVTQPVDRPRELDARTRDDDLCASRGARAHVVDARRLLHESPRVRVDDHGDARGHERRAHTRGDLVRHDRAIAVGERGYASTSPTTDVATLRGDPRGHLATSRYHPFMRSTSLGLLSVLTLLAGAACAGDPALRAASN